MTEPTDAETQVFTSPRSPLAQPNQDQSGDAPADQDRHDDATDQDQLDDAEPDTFPRAYVQQLRTEAAEHRLRAKRADDLAHRLHGALVAADGRLADPTDLPYDETHIEDEDALTIAIDALLAKKPHLAARRPAGDIGQGASASGDDFSLGALLRARAM